MVRKLPLALCLLGALLTLAMRGDPPPRVFPVSVVVDAGFTEIPMWKGMVRRAVETATDDLGRAAGIGFQVGEPQLWAAPDSARTWEEVLDRAAAEVGSESGLTAVFLADRPPLLRETEDMGIAYLAEPTLIVLCPLEPKDRIALADHLGLFLRHELGHVFGVPHMQGRTVMNPRPEEIGRDFDPLALDIIRANRNMDFQAEHPFEGSNLTALKNAYLFLDERNEMEPFLLRGLGSALYREDRGDEARVVIRAAARRERHSERALLELARTGAAQGDTVLVRELLGDLEEEPPDSLKGLEGELWLTLGDYGRARECFDRALENGPPRFQDLMNRGLAWFHQGGYSEAVRDFREALAAEERPEALFNLGLALLRTDRRDEAARAFTRYLELVPEGGRSGEARNLLEDIR